jgi:hypothetical protein
MQVQKPKRLAKLADIIWKKACCIPPSGKATLVLLLTYVISLSMVILPVVDSAAYLPFERKIETYQKADGSTGQRELSYFLDQLTSRIDVSEENLYHGIAEHFMLDLLVKKGEYFKGKWHGEWSYYDRKGKLTRIQVFDKGRLIIDKKLVRSGWKEQTWDDLSRREKEIYQKHEKGNPKGPDTMK